MLRLRAEADALDKATRLQVAQEQLAEYASEKSRAAATVLQHAEAVEAALAQLAAAGSAGGPAPAELLQQVAALKQQLADAALEAQAFSEQQQADVERLKRSSEQVGNSGQLQVVMYLMAAALPVAPVMRIPTVSACTSYSNLVSTSRRCSPAPAMVLIPVVQQHVFT